MQGRLFNAGAWLLGRIIPFGCKSVASNHADYIRPLTGVVSFPNGIFMTHKWGFTNNLPDWGDLPSGLF